MLEWIGYLEHKTNKHLNDFNTNVGKGGFTIFADIVYNKYGFYCQGVPWCVTFIFAVHPGLSWYNIGSPCTGVNQMIKQAAYRLRLRGIHYQPKAGDIILCRNNTYGNIDHVGIVIEIKNSIIYTLDGNTVDFTGHFSSIDGGCVAIRQRHIKDSHIAGYIKIGGLKSEDL